VPAALSALVMLGLSPLVTTALSIAGGHERGDARLWTGLAIGAAGVAISLAPELGNARVGAGVALSVIGMLGLAGGTVLQKRWVGASDPRVSVAAQAVAASALVVPVAVIAGGHVDLSAQFALTLAWLGWGLGVGAFSLFVRILRAHDASAVSALLLLVPPVTAIVAAPVLGETLHPAALAGMVVAMAGTGAVLRREARVPQLDHPARAREDARELHRPAWEPAVE
jgi:drug/metabolite transporter (DMT)-like permease